MRYIFINSDLEETIVSLDKVENYNQHTRKYSFTFNDEKMEYFERKLSGKTFISEDNLSWKKIAPFNNNFNFSVIEEMFKTYRGFKPSGLSEANPGALVTQMPGKVVKVMCKKGDSVTKGQTLMILEAMKMENEIKAGIDGSVSEVHIEEGQTLDSGHIMIEIE